MHKILTIFFTSLISLSSISQIISSDKNVIDTINLKDFRSDKIVVYKYDSITFFLNYDEFKTAIIKFMTKYKNDQPIKYPRFSYRRYKDAKRKSLKVLNNIIIELNRQIKNSDTVYIIHKSLDDRTLWSWGLNEIIIAQIEKTNCAIIDASNNKQYVIIKVKGTWNSSPITGSGGRRYYLLGNKDYFLDALDWIQ